VSKKSDLGQGNILNGWKAMFFGEKVSKSTSLLLLLASKPSFIDWYAKPSQTPTLICLPCRAIFACSKVMRNL
jgi:hypothetical protein